MTAFRLWLVTIMTVLGIYTGIVISNFGFTLIPIFFGDIAKMEWPGQFNLDFSFLLTLSAIWTAWRNNFSVTGILLAPVAAFGGAMFLSIYLLYLTFETKGDAREILIGKSRL